ncbi:MAG: hypothetical protein PHV37_05770 [Candidatus Gastranaerophilales bacterium]|nr:hypothetical protein [Candidatus Gastranaerophilales bacterium]
MKKKFDIRFLIVSFIITAGAAFAISYAPLNASTPATKAPVEVTATQQNQIIAVSPLEIVASPNKYLNKNVKFEATFDKFSTLGLDYKKAMRSSQNYIGMLIKRDNITDHTVPLSEMKLFMKRTDAEKYIDLESGDKVSITAKVFSSALGDPWLEINQFTVLTQKAKKDKK